MECVFRSIGEDRILLENLDERFFVQGSSCIRGCCLYSQLLS